MGKKRNIRQIEVFRAINQLKSASLDQVIGLVEPILEDSDSKSLKRAIRRDLNDLVESHYLTVDHYTPSGELISPEDEDSHKNTRAVYRVLGTVQADVRGKRCLDRNHIVLICKDSLVPSLNFTEDYTEIPSGKSVISIETGNESFVHLWFSPDDLPLKLNFSRKPTDLLSSELIEEIKENLERRSLVLLTPNQSVSRYRENEKLSHVSIGIESLEAPVSITNNLENKNVKMATKWDPEATLSLFRAQNETISVGVFEIEWASLESEKKVSSPCLIRVGDLFVFVRLAE